MRPKFLPCILVASSLVLSCNKAVDSNNTDGAEASSNVSESAMSEAGSQSTSSEGASAPFLGTDGFDEELKSIDFVDPGASTLSACAFITARSTCTTNVDTITWNSCSVGLATLTGGWTETWSAGFCNDGTRPGALTTGNSVTRTSASEVLTLASGASLTTNTAAHTAYDGTSLPATGISVSNTAGTRTIVINGLRKIFKGPLGRTWFDHSLKSTGLTVTGTRAGGNRVVTGSLTLYHNLAKYTAAHTFNSVTWGTSSCCYPTSGSISTTFSGATTGTASLAFTATCGAANFTDTSGATSAITLSQCR